MCEQFCKVLQEIKIETFHYNEKGNEKTDV